MLFALEYDEGRDIVTDPINSLRHGDGLRLVVEGMTRLL